MCPLQPEAPALRLLQIPERTWWRPRASEVLTAREVERRRWHAVRNSQKRKQDCGEQDCVWSRMCGQSKEQCEHASLSKKQTRRCEEGLGGGWMLGVAVAIATRTPEITTHTSFFEFSDYSYLSLVCRAKIFTKLVTNAAERDCDSVCLDQQREQRSKAPSSHPAHAPGCASRAANQHSTSSLRTQAQNRATVP